MSRSAFIREAIERMLEDTDDIEVSQARLADGEDPLIPWEQLSRWAPAVRDDSTAS